MAHSKLYVRLMNSAEWHRVRSAKMYKDAYCEECAKHGVLRSAEVVHHIQEIDGARTEEEAVGRAFAMTNLQSLCRRCHKKMHEGYHSRAAHKQRADDALERFANMVEGNCIDLLEIVAQDEEKPPP